MQTIITINGQPYGPSDPQCIETTVYNLQELLDIGAQHMGYAHGPLVSMTKVPEHQCQYVADKRRRSRCKVCGQVIASPRTSGSTWGIRRAALQRMGITADTVTEGGIIMHVRRGDRGAERPVSFTEVRGLTVTITQRDSVTTNLVFDNRTEQITFARRIAEQVPADLLAKSPEFVKLCRLVVAGADADN